MKRSSIHNSPKHRGKEPLAFDRVPLLLPFPGDLDDAYQIRDSDFLLGCSEVARRSSGRGVSLATRSGRTGASLARPEPSHGDRPGVPFRRQALATSWCRSGRPYQLTSWPGAHKAAMLGRNRVLGRMALWHPFTVYSVTGCR